LQEIFEGAVTIGMCRMVHQDNEFAVSQIVEIALRAMSPGLNDPTTAVTCVDWLGDSIRTLARYPCPNPARVDNSGKVRVVEKVNDFERVVAAAFDPIRQVARNSPMLTIRLLNTFSGIAPFMQTITQRGALYSQVELTFEGFTADAVSRDRADVSAAYYRAVRALRPAWAPAGRAG
jgi:uncharacterized membrane protein